MKRRLKAQGVKPNQVGLRIFFTIEYAGTIRFAEVVVPAFMLTAEDVIKRIEKQQAQELRAKWSDDTALPLEAWE